MKKITNIILIVAACLAIPVGIVGTVHTSYYKDVYSTGGIKYHFNETDSKWEVVGVDKNNSLSKSSQLTIASFISNYPVKTINKSAFRNVSTLVQLFLPSTLTTIEAGAFYKCKSLTTISDRTYKLLIEHDAFIDCDNISYYQIESSKNVYASTSNTFNYDYNDYKKLEITNCNSSISNQNWIAIRSYLDTTNALIRS